jgi:hypothetical protein
MIDQSKIARCAKNAALTALIVLASTLIVSISRPLIGMVFGGRFRFDWVLSLKLSFAFSFAWFLFFFFWNLIAAVRAQPVFEILEEAASESDRRQPALFGFVAMEYFWLILNRTFVIFVTLDGLYGWRARGPVSNSNPRYFETYQEMLKGEEFTRDRRAIQKLSRLAGGFLIDWSQVVSIEADDRQKWGMGGIPHSGRVHVRLKSGKSREFILLGSDAIPEIVRDKMVSAMGSRAMALV